jgi:Spy/CpxP family protein refolding chaperone
MTKHLAAMMVGLLMLCATPSASFGQDVPAGTWWHSPQLAQQLKLTDREVRRLDRMYVETRRKLIQIKNAIERERFELDNLLESQSMDEPLVKDQFERLERERTRLADARFRFLLEVRKIMGSERFQHLKHLYNRGKSP